MRLLLTILLLLSPQLFAQPKETTMSIYDYEVKDIHGKEIALSKYRGKVLLIVNVASKCGFTSQYEGLEKLYRTYKDDGLEILGFPSNQFSEQEPGSDKEVLFFCQTTYDVTFDMFSKIDVNGEDAIPLYKYLKAQQSGFLGSKAIKWNFTKFLVDREGKVIDRYGSSTKPESIEEDIKTLLKR